MVLKTKQTKKSWQNLPPHSGKVLLIALLFSILSHVFSGGYLSNNRHPINLNLNNNQKVKIREFTAAEKKLLEEMKKKQLNLKFLTFTV